MHVEGMMKTDPKLMAIMNKFIQENREVISYDVYENQIFILSKEKVWMRRLHANKLNLHKKLQKKNSG